MGSQPSPEEKKKHFRQVYVLVAWRVLCENFQNYIVHYQASVTLVGILEIYSVRVSWYLFTM